jgi:hypothetical protein
VRCDRRLHRAADAAGRGDVVFLDEDAVVEADAVVLAPPARTAYFCAMRRPGSVFLVS